MESSSRLPISKRVFLKNPRLKSQCNDLPGIQFQVKGPKSEMRSSNCPCSAPALKISEPTSEPKTASAVCLYPPLTPARTPLRGQKNGALNYGSKSVESAPESNHLDTWFIRAASCKENINGKSYYKCSRCLQYFQRLASLQTHIAHGWKKDFSCRVFYHKMKEIQSEQGLRKAQKSLKVTSCLPPAVGIEDLSTTRKTVVTQDTSETERRNSAIQKWLSEIEAPDTIQL